MSHCPSNLPPTSYAASLDVASKPKRPAKRKSLDPDPDPAVVYDPSDDEPLVPKSRKRAKTKASAATSSKSKADSKKPALVKEDEADDKRPSKPRRSFDILPIHVLWVLI